MSTIQTHVQKSSRIFLIKMTTLKIFDRSIKVVIQGDEGRLLLLLQQKKVLTHEIKSVFWSVMVAKLIEMQLTIFFPIIMLGGVSQVMSWNNFLNGLQACLDRIFILDLSLISGNNKRLKLLWWSTQNILPIFTQNKCFNIDTYRFK